MALQSTDLFVVQSAGDKKAWKLSFNKLQAAIEGGSGINFRGSVDLNTIPTGQLTPDPPLNGDMYIVSADADPINANWDMANGVTVANENDRIVYDSTTTDWLLVAGGSNTGGTVVSVTGETPIEVDNGDPTAPVISIDQATTAQAGYVSRLAEAADLEDDALTTGAVVTAELIRIIDCGEYS